MKILIVICLSLWFISNSCADHTAPANKQASADSTVINVQNSTISTAQKDSLTDTSPAFPKWLTSLYEKETLDTVTSWGIKTEVIFFRPLSDSTSYCIYEESTGVSLNTRLATQKNKQPYKEMEIGSEPDGDASVPYYSSTSYTHDSVKTRIRSVKYEETPKAKYLTKDQYGRTEFKTGYDMENAETTTDSTITIIKISPTGELIKQ